MSRGVRKQIQEEICRSEDQEIVFPLDIQREYCKIEGEQTGNVAEFAFDLGWLWAILDFVALNNTNINRYQHRHVCPQCGRILIPLPPSDYYFLCADGCARVEIKEKWRDQLKYQIDKNDLIFPDELQGKATFGRRIPDAGQASEFAFQLGYQACVRILRNANG